MIQPSGRSISVLVVDDETLARRNLTILLRDDADIASIEECASGIEAVTAIRKRKPDLMFLDVQMPECDGFDVLELLGTDAPETIIFVTAHDQYALRAFDAGALDYLLKPFDDRRFARALARAKAKLETYASPKDPPRRLAIKSNGRIMFITMTDIEWVEAASYYSCLHVGQETHAIRRTMAELDRDLGPNFFRIHRSTIVNLARVRGLETVRSGELVVAMGSGAQLPLSRRCRKSLESRLAQLMVATGHHG